MVAVVIFPSGVSPVNTWLRMVIGHLVRMRLLTDEYEVKSYG